MKIIDPAADLAVVAALISAAANKSLPEKSIFFGEIGLSGEIREVTQTEARIKEASKLDFKRVFCAANQDLKDSIGSIMHLKQLKDLFL